MSLPTRKLWLEMSRDERRLYAYENFRTWLTDLATKYTMRSIAFAAGVDHGTISRLIRFDREPSLVTAKKIIEAYL